MTDAQMSRLALQFPTLRQAPGVQPWQPQQLERWACGPAPSSAAAHAARFMLAVWDNRRQWRCGAFDLIDAIRIWDETHAAAMQAWVSKPWLP